MIIDKTKTGKENLRPFRTHVGMEFPVKLLCEVDVIAEEEHRSRSAMIRVLVREALVRRGLENA